MNIKLVTYTSLYPNNIQKNHGIFVENRLVHLMKSSNIECKVIAPVPWFPPLKWGIFEKYAIYNKVNINEYRNGVQVLHPKYFIIPKIGMSLAPFLLALSTLKYLKFLIKSGYNFELIDSHYFYPDGVAAIIIGKILNKPVVITARGTDLNLIPQYLIARKLIQWAAKESAAIITVCQALKNTLVDLGVNGDKVHVMRNGVDLNLFSLSKNRTLLRERLGFSGSIILSVGQLIARKGHDIIIKALSFLENVTLLIAGSGPEKKFLLTLAQNLGVERRVRFLGNIPHKDLPDYYRAADVLALASSREGWANVLLESMACGTPVAASKIWGTPEVVCSPEAGLLVETIAPEEFAGAIKKLLVNPPDREATRKYAEQFSWDATTQGQLNLFNTLLGKNIQ